LKKAIVVVALLVGAAITAGGGYVGYERYTQQQFTASLVPHVKNASLRTQNALRAEIDNPQMTYKELFTRLEEDISAVGSRILEVQTVTTEKNKALSEPMVAYLKATQEMLRAMLSESRKSLSLSTAQKMVDDALREMRSSDSYSVRFALNSFNSRIEERNKARQEYTESIRSLHDTGTRLKESLLALKPSVPSDALIEISDLESKINSTAAAGEKEKVKLPPKPGCKIEQMSWGEQYNCA
jgi:hypothetical protein